MWWAGAAAYIGTFCTVLMLGQANAMLPTLVDYFHTDVATIQWVVLAYSVTMAGLLLAFGRLADVAGRKRIYTIGYAGFAVGSLLCAASPSFPLFLVSRIVQGVFAAMIGANAVAVITQTFAAEQRGMALGMWSTVTASAQLLGPSLAGLLIQGVGWQANFGVQAGLGTLGAVLAHRALPDFPRQAAPFDLSGAAALAVTIASFTVLLNRGPKLGWTSPLALGLLALGLLAGAAFGWLSRRATAPVLSLRLLANRRFAFSNACVFLTWMGLQATGFVLPFFLQKVVGLSPAEMGLMLMAQPALILVVSPLGGWLTDRFGSRLPATAGTLCDVAAVLFLATATPATARSGLVLRLAATGVGAGLAQAANSAAIMGEAPRGQAGMASGLAGTMRHLGLVTGTAVIGTFFSVRSGMHAGAGAPIEAGYFAGFRDALYVLAFTHGLSALVSALRGPHQAEPAVA